MANRREFLQAAAAAAAVSQRVLGANDRVRMAVIGAGSRGAIVTALFLKHADCEFVAACDVRESRLSNLLKQVDRNMETYRDYRRILDRKDIDAVLVTTPDHWHSPIVVDACAAGKDSYVEKPLSNTIPAAQRMLEAARKYNRVVQVGTQQRSGQHFQEVGKLVQEGLLGNVSHAVLFQPGAYTQITQPPEPPPADLDWEAFQGPAPRKPFSPSRLRWRSYYDYGGGLVTDWGVHLTDIALMYLKADGKGPLLTSASAQFINFPRDDEQVPDAFTCSWQYDNFVMTFSNVVPPMQGINAQGNWFFGQKGILHVNRSGYQVFPAPARGGGRGAPAVPAIETKVVSVKEDYQNDPSTIAHARNFLDCVKSRRRPICDVEIGFNSTLPTLIALLAIQQGRTFRWDGTTARPA
jgi:predicted dehydrogenase